MVTVQSIQPTPNPNAFKFVCDELLFQGTKNYATAGEAKGHELAEQLFALEGVDTLFFCDKFVTVSMTPEADWRTVHEQATRVLGEAASPYGSGTPAPAQAAEGGDAASGALDPESLDPAQRQMFDQINDILDDRVRPALAGDGGGLEVIGLDGKTLLIRYQGACGSCPSSIGGTLMAIQNLLQSEVDEELAVVSA